MGKGLGNGVIIINIDPSPSHLHWSTTTTILFPTLLWFFFLTQIISHSTRPAPQTKQTHHHQHTHMLTALAYTEHHLPMHPLHTCKIINNPRPLPMPYNWVLFVGSLLMWDATSLKWKRCFKCWLAGIYSLKNAKVYIVAVFVFWFCCFLFAYFVIAPGINSPFSIWSCSSLRLRSQIKRRKISEEVYDVVLFKTH